MSTKITDKGARRILGLIGELKASSVDVGALDEETARKLAYAEFGTATAPARPVVRQTIEARRAKMGQTMAAELGAAVARGNSADAALDKIGEAFALELRAAIYAFNDPPNAPTTVLKKLKNDPLVDSGAMARGVKWRVVKTREKR